MRGEFIFVYPVFNPLLLQSKFCMKTLTTVENIENMVENHNVKVDDLEHIEIDPILRNVLITRRHWANPGHNFSAVEVLHSGQRLFVVFRSFLQQVIQVLHNSELRPMHGHQLQVSAVLSFVFMPVCVQNRLEDRVDSHQLFVTELIHRLLVLFFK